MKKNETVDPASGFKIQSIVSANDPKSFHALKIRSIILIQKGLQGKRLLSLPIPINRDYNQLTTPETV